MLSKKMEDALNAQINAEFWSAYLYLSMSSNFAALGNPGFANWFSVQFKEEQDHAMILIKYILSRGGKVTLAPIDKVQTEWSSPLAAFEDTLAHEKKVTSMIIICMLWPKKKKTMQQRACWDGLSMSKSRKKKRLRGISMP